MPSGDRQKARCAYERLMCWFLSVHCSWMNQVEQWFGILQRKQLRISDFTDLDHLAKRLMVFVAEWNTRAHPFNWSTKSEALVMAKYQAQPLWLQQHPFRFFFLRLRTSNSQALSAHDNVQA